MQRTTPSSSSTAGTAASRSAAEAESLRAPGPSRSASFLGAPGLRLSGSLRSAAVLGLAALGAMAWGWGPLGCSSSSPSTGSTGTGGSFCEGGFVRMVDGKPTCEGLCKPELCTNANNVCVDNDCALTCTAHLDCQLGQSCAPSKEDGTGTMVDTCQSTGKAAIGTKCYFGNECKTITACVDGTPCTADTDCKTGTCNPLACLTAGSGDADAYCTLKDCHADTDCPGGYWCDTVRDPHQICGKAKPDANICGTTSDPCVDPSMDAANGTTYEPGAYCTERNECRIRSQCDPCTTDLDCSLVAGQKCVNGACAASCNTDADCVNGFECTSGACVPRSGSCAPAAAGAAKLCDSCRTQADCAPGLLCGELEPGGLRACLSESNGSCNSDSDCPKAVSGLHALCVDERLQVSPGQPGYHTCYIAPFFTANDSFDCWCQNKGSACIYSTDCCSGSCVGSDVASMVAGTCAK